MIGPAIVGALRQKPNPFDHRVIAGPYDPDFFVHVPKLSQPALDDVLRAIAGQRTRALPAAPIVRIIGSPGSGKSHLLRVVTHTLHAADAPPLAGSKSDVRWGDGGGWVVEVVEADFTTAQAGVDGDAVDGAAILLSALRRFLLRHDLPGLGRLRPVDWAAQRIIATLPASSESPATAPKAASRRSSESFAEFLHKKDFPAPVLAALQAAVRPDQPWHEIFGKLDPGPRDDVVLALLRAVRQSAPRSVLLRERVVRAAVSAGRIDDVFRHEASAGPRSALEWLRDCSQLCHELNFALVFAFDSVTAPPPAVTAKWREAWGDGADGKSMCPMVVMAACDEADFATAIDDPNGVWLDRPSAPARLADTETAVLVAREFLRDFWQRVAADVSAAPTMAAKLAPFGADGLKRLHRQFLATCPPARPTPRGWLETCATAWEHLIFDGSPDTIVQRLRDWHETAPPSAPSAPALSAGVGVRAKLSPLAAAAVRDAAVAPASRAVVATPAAFAASPTASDWANVPGFAELVTAEIGNTAADAHRATQRLADVLAHGFALGLAPLISALPTLVTTATTPALRFGSFGADVLCVVGYGDDADGIQRDLSSTIVLAQTLRPAHAVLFRLRDLPLPTGFVMPPTVGPTAVHLRASAWGDWVRVCYLAWLAHQWCPQHPNLPIIAPETDFSAVITAVLTEWDFFAPLRHFRPDGW